MNKSFYTRVTCRLCGNNKLENVVPLTPTALCDAYVSTERIDEIQEVYPLALFLCRDCGYVHLPYVVDPEIIYRDYIYVTTSSLGLPEHFENYSDEVLSRINPPEKALVVDIGSNDGALLKFFQKRGLRILGIDPAKEIAHQATQSGVETITDFFTACLAEKIRNNYGPATVITINNLLANIDDLAETAEGIRRLLAADGVFVIESSYLADLIQHLVFDFIYHEHLSYFSIKPLARFFGRFDMELIDIEHVPTKGGSLRYYFQMKGGPRQVSSSVAEMTGYEETLNLDKAETFRSFCEKIESRKKKLLDYLYKLKAQHKTIVGYGASATSTTLIYHFGLADFMDYLVDDNPSKHNRFSPGYHIPVLPSDILYDRRPDCALLLAWRYAEPIIHKHQRFLHDGGHFVVPLPDLNIIGAKP